MAEIRGKLTRKQEEVIVALLSQRNAEEAARVTKIGSRTIYRWMKDPDFDRAYREAKRAAFSKANRALAPNDRRVSWSQSWSRCEKTRFSTVASKSSRGASSRRERPRVRRDSHFVIRQIRDIAE